MAHGHDSGAVLKGLRKVFGGNDAFMRGHQIKRTRSLSDGRAVPEWATDDKAVQKLLLQSFPKLASNVRQRTRAGRWVRVIQLYFKSKKSRREVSEDMGESENVVRMLIRSIKWAQKGKRANGTGLRTQKVLVTPTPPLSESE